MKKDNGQEFGERLRKLRKDRNLSQFRLGSLVGVTDKAVSKWESGAAIPSMKVLARIAEAMNVNLKDLADGAEPAVPLEGRDLIRHREVLWRKAQEQLNRIYGANPPLPVLNRFYREKNLMVFTDAVILFDILHELLLEAEKEGKEIRNDGNWCGCFTAWLLGASPVNPLPAHYRCPKCGRMEFHPEELSGWDLPDRQCECGTEMIRDGQDLPYESLICGTGEPVVTIELEIPASFLEDAQKVILREAGPYFSLRVHQAPTEDGKYIPVTSLFFEAKKEDKTPEYIEDIRRVEELFNWGTSISYPAFRLIPLPDRKRTGRKANPRTPTLNDLLQGEVLFRALQHQNRSKESEKEYSGMDFTLWNPEKYREGLTFGKLVSILCTMENAYMPQNPEAMAETTGINLTELPASREDLRKMILTCTPNPAEAEGIAEEIIFRCERGYYIHNPEDTKLFQRLNIPDWFTKYAKNIMTLCSRSAVTAQAYRLMKEEWQKMQIEPRDRS